MLFPSQSGPNSRSSSKRQGREFFAEAPVQVSLAPGKTDSGSQKVFQVGASQRSGRVVGNAGRALKASYSLPQGGSP